jgi:hypothetical protein
MTQTLKRIGTEAECSCAGYQNQSIMRHFYQLIPSINSQISFTTVQKNTMNHLNYHVNKQQFVGSKIIITLVSGKVRRYDLREAILLLICYSLSKSIVFSTDNQAVTDEMRMYKIVVVL